MDVLRRSISPDTIESTSPHGVRALHLAARHGRLEAARLLLDRGAQIDAVTNDHHTQRTPLHLAANGGHLEVVRLLLERGASVAARDLDGDTAESLASKQAHHATASLLREWGRGGGGASCSSGGGAGAGSGGGTSAEAAIGGAATAGAATAATATATAADAPAAGLSDQLCCATCGASEGEAVELFRCAGCRDVRYCGKDCARIGWRNGHKEVCKYKAGSGGSAAAGDKKKKKKRAQQKAKVKGQA